MRRYCTHSIVVLLPVILFLAILLVGCGPTRYDNTVKTYTHKNTSGSKVYTNYGPATQRYTIGKDDTATAQYYYKHGSRQPTRPVSGSSSASSGAYGNGKNGSGLNMNNQNLVVLDATDVLFEFDKAIIRKAYYPELDKWAEFFHNNPMTTADIYGHADSTGPLKYNQGLSERRAQSIVRYLVDKGIEEGRLTPIGFGETQPVAPNDTAAGRQLNRRVEVNIKK